jgi:hypothetical protein
VAEPAIMSIDDEPAVLHAVQRDLRRNGVIRPIATAVGEAALAASFVRRYLETG